MTIHRRTLLKSSIPALAVTTALGAAVQKGGHDHWSDLTAADDKRLRVALKALREATGQSMDQWADWLYGLPVAEVERIAENAARRRKAFTGEVVEDPHPEWLARWKGLKHDFKRIEAQWKAGDLSDGDFEDAADIRLNRRWDLVKVAGITPANTVPGAAAMAEMFDLEFGIDAFGKNQRCPDGQLLTNLVNSLQGMA